MAIDIGTPAIDRGGSYGTSTRVAKGNPANATGAITSVEIWADTTMYSVEVATFFVVSGNNLSTRDSEAIGTVEEGSKQTFSALDMNVNTGDYLGVYYSAGFIEADLADGLGYWYFAADQIPCVNIEFSSNVTRTLSLYGTGEEAGEGTTVTPGLIALILTEYASILKEVTTPTTLSLIDTEYIPVLDTGIIIGLLGLSITEYVPILKELLTPAALALSTSAYIPVITVLGSISVTPSTLALILVGYIPVIVIPSKRRNVSDDFWDWGYEPPVRVTITPLPDEIQFKESK